MSGFNGTFATGVACQQGTLTLPDTWFRPSFWDFLVLQLLSPDSSSFPCLYSTFHLEYSLVLSRFCFTWYHNLLLELISFQKLHPPKHRQRQIVNYAMRIQRLHSCKIIVEFWYCLACCILYSTKSKETSMKRSASSHVSLKYTQRTFYSLLRAYCFPNNFDLNLV